MTPLSVLLKCVAGYSILRKQLVDNDGMSKQFYTFAAPPALYILNRSHDLAYYRKQTSSEVNPCLGDLLMCNQLKPGMTATDQDFSTYTGE